MFLPNAEDVANFSLRFHHEGCRLLANAFSVSTNLVWIPMVVASLQPWAGISQRLRRLPLMPHEINEVACDLEGSAFTPDAA